MNELDNLKSKITYENKTSIGVVGLILAFLFWAIGSPNIGLGDVLLLIFPAIFLVIPSETLKNNKILGIISAVILLLLLLVGISTMSVVITEYLPDSYMFPEGYVAKMFIAQLLQIILCLYGLFCAYLLTIETKENQTSTNSQNRNIVANNNAKKFDKYCTECGQGLFEDSNFCPSCGTKLIEYDDEIE